MKTLITYRDIVAAHQMEDQLLDVEKKIIHLFEFGYSPAQIAEMIGYDTPTEKSKILEYIGSIRKEWAPVHAAKIYNATNEHEQKSGHPAKGSRFGKFITSLTRHK
jgi:hypothetical protein